MNSFELIPTEENLIHTLDKDLLKRNKDLVRFYDLILVQEGASSIAIDGRWGSGKTFFVKQSMLLINAKNPMSDMDDEKKASIVYALPFPKKAEDMPENYDVAVYFENSYFPMKSYGDVTFPPGEYEAFRIDIGAHDGKNWWCVLYPPLCFVDTSYGVLPDTSKDTLKNILTEDEYNAITNTRVEYRCKYLTFLNRLFAEKK